MVTSTLGGHITLHVILHAIKSVEDVLAERDTPSCFTQGVSVLFVHLGLFQAIYSAAFYAHKSTKNCGHFIAK